MINESDRVLAQTSGLPVTWCKMLGMQQHVSYISHLFLYKKDSSVTLSLRRCQRKHFPLTCGKLRVIQTTRISWMISKACQLMPAGMFFVGESCRNIPRAGSGQRLFTLASPPPGRAQRRDPKGQRSEQANGRESGCLHGFSQETVCLYPCR